MCALRPTALSWRICALLLAVRFMSACDSTTDPCSYSLSKTSESVAGGGGTGNVGVTAQAGCTWTATSNVDWITVTSGASGSGDGTVGYSVHSNGPLTARSGTLTIAGATFTVNQELNRPERDPSAEEQDETTSLFFGQFRWQQKLRELEQDERRKNE